LLLSYALAAATSASAVLLHAALGALFGLRSPLPIFYPAVTVVASLAGTWPGSVTTLLCAGAALGSSAVWPGVPGPPADPEWILFLVGGVAISAVTGLVTADTRKHHGRVGALEDQISRLHVEADERLAASGALERRLEERDALLVRQEAARGELQRRQREASLIAELSRTLNESLAIDAMLEPLAGTARELCAADGVRLFMRISGSQALVQTYAGGVRRAERSGRRVDHARGAVRLVAASGRPLRSALVATDPRLADDELWAGEESRDIAVLLVPIGNGQPLEGLICLENRAGRPFTDRDEELIVRVADHARIAIRNAQLLAGEQSARVEAEAANRAKDEFLAMLGHELRNPLGAIGNATTVLRQIGEQSARLQQIIGRQTRHLARILDDLLDVSRLTTGKIGLDLRPVDLRKVVDDSLAAAEQEGKTSRHQVEVHGGSVAVHGDPARLEQVVRNLLDNAVKYTPPGGRVTITLGQEDGDAVLRVRDSGAGIPSETLPRIFELFVQGEGGLDRSKGGLGVGLTLVRRLVQLHGGTVSAASAGPDLGSEFVVRLPSLTQGTVPDEPETLPGPASRPCHVLLVEDNADLREGLRLLIQGWGHRVDETGDGRTGLAMLLERHPDVALIDLGLPGMDGYALTRAARAAPGGDAILLVAVTGYGQPEDQRRAREAGFDAHLVKPIDPDALARLLDGVASRSRS
jgi:signal transduction histidine kinase